MIQHNHFKWQNYFSLDSLLFNETWLYCCLLQGTGCRTLFVFASISCLVFLICLKFQHFLVQKRTLWQVREYLVVLHQLLILKMISCILYNMPYVCFQLPLSTFYKAHSRATHIGKYLYISFLLIVSFLKKCMKMNLAICERFVLGLLLYLLKFTLLLTLLYTVIVFSNSDSAFFSRSFFYASI